MLTLDPSKKTVELKLMVPPHLEAGEIAAAQPCRDTRSAALCSDLHLPRMLLVMLQGRQER